MAAVQPEHLATLIYTSGTTGRPKGVELPHRCWTYIGAGAEAIEILRRDDLQYLWLPLSHSFGKMLEAVQLQIGFPTAVDGRIDKIVENLAVVRPTFMAGPPRIFEKVHAQGRADRPGRGRDQAPAVHLGVRGRRPGLAAALEGQPTGPGAAGAVRAGRPAGAVEDPRAAGRPHPLPGLGQRAAVRRTSPPWFHAAGLPVLEGYALTETSAGGAASAASRTRCSGVVGPPLVGSEVRIADDGEILLRGPVVMRGYHNLPAATAEVLDADGWFATGDVGELDAAGRLRSPTGRRT